MDGSIAHDSSLITDADVRAYRRHGWLRVRGVLDAAQRAQIRESWEAALRNPWDNSDIYAAVEKSPISVPQDKPRTRQVMAIIREPRFMDPKVDTIARDPRIGRMVCRLLGSPHARLFSEALLEKPPASEGSKETPWHQDSCYEPFDRRDAVNVWAAIEDMPLEQGPIEFLTGSHRLGGMGRFDFGDPVEVAEMFNEDDIELLHSLRCEGDVAGPRGVPIARCDLKAGDALVWAGLTLHHAQPNRTEQRRRAYQRMYISSEVRYSGQPDIHSDGLGMKLGQHFDLDRFPLVA